MAHPANPYTPGVERTVAAGRALVDAAGKATAFAGCNRPARRGLRFVGPGSERSSDSKPESHHRSRGAWWGQADDPLPAPAQGIADDRGSLRYAERSFCPYFRERLYVYISAL